MTSLAIARFVGIAGRLSPTDLLIEPGQAVAVIGPNGGGKTSLLRGLARTEDADGSVSVEGHDLDQASEAGRRRLLAFMPASREAPWPIRVADWIELGLSEPDVARCTALIRALELEPLVDRTIDRLSTGERARAMLARALAGKARLLLLDEPLSNLDPYWVLRTLDLLGEEARKGSTVMVALHDIALVERFDRVLLVDHGRLVGDGLPPLLEDRLGALFGVRAAPGGGWQIAR
ncbi:MAG: ABC transporter ATP-binding protein [Sphingomicrobium sp.]